MGFSLNLSAVPQIEELAPLDFGTFAITGNSSVSTLVFPRTGRNLAITGSFVLVAEGIPGRFRLSGFPPNMGIEVEADNTALTAGGTGIPEPLAISNYDFSDLRTNSAGEAELQLGGTLSTSGNGGEYDDAPYEGSTQLRFYYWEPQVNDYVTVSQNITLMGAVRTGFQLEEAQSMHFGRLFAQASAGDQASIRLTPDGRIELNSPGQTRLLSLTEARPAVLVVSGAAPNRDLSIEPQAGDILLKHKQMPSGPHFILNQLSTSPDETGRTDSEGSLEIRVGGTLSTQQTASTIVYPAGVYEGVYSITVAY